MFENPSTTENKAKMEQLVQKYDTNECISFMIPNAMKKEKIQLFTNLINEQKDFSNEVKIAYNDDYEGYSKETIEAARSDYKISKDEYDYFYSLSPEERIDAIGEMLGKLIDFGDVY